MPIIIAEERRQRQAKYEDPHDDADRHFGALQRPLQKLVVLREHVVVAAVERLQHTLQPSTFALAVRFIAMLRLDEP
jgi:hypothetical protein